MLWHQKRDLETWKTRSLRRLPALVQNIELLEFSYFRFPISYFSFQKKFSRESEIHLSFTELVEISFSMPHEPDGLHLVLPLVI